jgi:hypothetical protein
MTPRQNDMVGLGSAGSNQPDKVFLAGTPLHTWEKQYANI